MKLNKSDFICNSIVCCQQTIKQIFNCHKNDSVHSIIYYSALRKSTEQLNDLRPITLPNCDLKIITKKTFANRMSKADAKTTPS